MGLYVVGVIDHADAYEPFAYGEDLTVMSITM